MDQRPTTFSVAAVTSLVRKVEVNGIFGDTGLWEEDRIQINFRDNTEPYSVQTPLPERPWKRLAADIAKFRGHHFLVIVNYYSSCVEIMNLKDLTCYDVIKKLKCTCSLC